MSKIAFEKHKKLRHTRTIHRARGVCRISRHPCPLLSFSLPLVSPFRFFALACKASGADVQERNGAPSRPEKCSVLGGWPLDTTNRYRPFDMDLGIVQPNAKVLSAPFLDTVAMQYRSRPSQSCFSSFVSFVTDKVTVLRYPYFAVRWNKLIHLSI